MQRSVARVLARLPRRLRSFGIEAHTDNAGIGDTTESYGHEPGRSVNDLLLAGDRIHPNQAGQAFVCRRLAEALVKHVL